MLHAQKRVHTCYRLKLPKTKYTLPYLPQFAELLVVLLKAGSAEYGEFDILERVQVILDGFGGGVCDDSWVVHECPAAECSENNAFDFIRDGDIQNAAEPLDVQLL